MIHPKITGRSFLNMLLVWLFLPLVLTFLYYFFNTFFLSEQQEGEYPVHSNTFERIYGLMGKVNMAVLGPFMDGNKKFLIGGEFYPDSYESLVLATYFRRSQMPFVLVASVDKHANNGYVGVFDILEYEPSIRNIPSKKLLGLSASHKLFKNTNEDLYDGGQRLFSKMFSMEILCLSNDWEIIKTPQGRRLRPYWNEERARKIFHAIPRNSTSVTAVVQKGTQRIVGIGSSVRAAVVSALPGDVPFISPDIEQLTVITNGDFRLHEINAAVFSDDLAFIRTTLGNLEHLDLSQARFYNDTVPRSALDCSKNIEYAYNLPKGNLPKLERVDLPPVVSVDWYAFRHLPALKNINLPNTRHIAAQAFEGCVSLSAVNALKLETLGQGAFFHCNALKGLVFPHLMSIKRYALSPSVQTIAIPKTAIKDTGDLAALNAENNSVSASSWSGSLLLFSKDNANKKREPKKIMIYVKADQHPYTMPRFNPQLTAEEITMVAGTSEDIPIRFTDKNVSLRMAWGHSDNPSITQITVDGKISASAPGNAVLTITDIVADVTLQAGKKAHVFSNWSVELKKPLRLRVKVE